MSAGRLILRYFRAQNLVFFRTPIASFFTIGLPVVMLILFVAMFGNDDIVSGDESITTSQFYAPGLAVFSAASATYTNIAMSLSTRRDLGILKRVRGTPIAPWMYMAAVILSGVFIAFASMTLMVGLGIAAYGINIELAKVPGMALAFLVGSTCFATLGVAIASVAKSANSASSLTNATLLPLGFISNVFVSFGDDSPRWLEVLGDLFPLKHFAVAFSEAMSPFSAAPAIEWGHLAVLLGWMSFGVMVALRRFRWEPVPGGSAGPGRRSRRSRR